MEDEMTTKKEEAKSNSNDENPNNSNSNSNSNESDSQITDDDEGLNLVSSRTPFTNLSQVDADLALARTLQEQERAYMMLRMNGERAGDFGTSEEEETASYVDEDDYEDEDEDEDEDASDAHGHEAEVNANLDPSAFTSDEAFARALQDAEERELAARMMALSGAALLHDDDWDPEDNDTNSQDTWEEVDPDELSYEELLALGEVVGTESRGLSAEKIASLPSVNYKAQSSQDCNTDQCVICRLEFEDEDTLTVLSCKHIYHSECINNWLQINKVCPVCGAEVSISDNR